MFTSLLYVGSDRCHHNDNGILSGIEPSIPSVDYCIFYGRLLLFKNILNEINFSPQKYFNDLTFELGSSALIR